MSLGSFNQRKPTAISSPPIPLASWRRGATTTTAQKPASRPNHS
jgi:hypothetical protein